MKTISKQTLNQLSNKQGNRMETSKFKIQVAALACLLGTAAFGQWVDPGSDGTGSIYYNGGNVGLGTGAPDALLHVKGKALVGANAAPNGSQYTLAFNKWAGIWAGTNDGWHDEFYINHNAYYGNGAWRYRDTNNLGTGATYMNMGAGKFSLRTAIPGDGDSIVSWNNAIYVNQNGLVGITHTNPETPLDVRGAITVRSAPAPLVSASGQARIYYDTPSNKVKISENGGPYIDLINASGSDNLGNHTAQQNINLNGHWLSGDGTDEGIYVDNSGKVGIGVSNPSAMLDLTGFSNTTAGMKMETNWGNINTPLAFFNSTADGKVLRIQNNGHRTDVNIFEVVNDQDTVFAVRGDGNVGIGVTNPSAALEVGGFPSSHNIPGFKVESDWGSMTNPMILFKTNGDGQVMRLQQNGARADMKLFEMVNSNGTAFAVMGDGKVTLGVDNPTEKLSVKGNIQLGDGGTHGALYFNNTSSGNITVNGSNIMRMLANGNVGIGTVDPQSKLSVNGTVTAKEVIITLDGWADYVFDEDYELMPLNEVEQYIKSNKHLPDVPSEAEMLSKPTKLGETDAMFMKKIEELTLYLIEQNKAIEELREENKALREMVGK